MTLARLDLSGGSVGNGILQTSPTVVDGELKDVPGTWHLYAVAGS